MKSLLCTAMFLMGIFATNCIADDQRPVVKIGAILPLSGGLAHLGAAYRDAMTLAAEELPESTRFRYVLVFEDNQLDLKKTVSVPSGKFFHFPGGTLFLPQGKNPRRENTAC